MAVAQAAVPGPSGRKSAVAGRSQGRKPVVSNRIPPLSLALFFTLLFACSPILSTIRANPNVPPAIWGAAACLLLFTFFLNRDKARSGRLLHYSFVPRSVHYVQMMAHSSIYLYWGAYWPEVYHHVPQLFVQIAFAYAFDMLVCWSRRDEWFLGFGLIPIVLSTNLFLWFKDDWFYLQLLLIATGILGKEFIKWKRDGRMTHIFNPSAFSLFLFSVALIAAGATRMTFGEEIAVTLGRPPHIYLEIFLLGLVVQALFQVTLVTLSAASALCLLNVAFTGWTGVYHFIDSNIPIAVFLGLHLLVTDPATSPKRPFGKIVFGAMYGTGVFLMYGFLSWLGAPRFYDKLLCVPALNLTVQALDRASTVVEQRLRSLNFSVIRGLRGWSPKQANFGYMAIWISLFAVLMSTGFVSGRHPGESTEFWHKACDQGRWNACKTWEHALAVTCDQNAGTDCFTLGVMRQEGRLVKKNPIEAARNFDQSCDLGYPFGCASLQGLVESSGPEIFQQACDHGHGPSCYILGLQYQRGRIFPKDGARAVAMFKQACEEGWSRGCGRLGEVYFLGAGTSVDKKKALESFEKACEGGYGPACFNAGILYRRGDTGRKDDAYGLRRIQQACAMGIRAACPAAAPGTRQ
jgi:TPR repeat protein